MLAVRHDEDRQKGNHTEIAEDHAACVADALEQEGVDQRVHDHGEREHPDHDNQLCGFVAVSGIFTDDAVQFLEDIILIHKFPDSGKRFS